MEKTGAAGPIKVAEIEVVATNFKRRLSGVTSTIIQLVPLQARTVRIATLGPGLPSDLPSIAWRDTWRLFRRPERRPFRIWHARRNPEMLAGILLKLMGAPLRLVFTSASQRKHTRWSKFLIRRMDAVVATSRKTAAYLEVPNTVIMHGIDTDRFCQPPDKAGAVAALGLSPKQFYVGCFGRVRRQKGTDLFVDAMISLLPHYPNWSAVVAGRTTAENRRFESELKQRAARAGLADRILFVGERRDIARWYKALSLFVAPQRWEGFGLTPLEAMASGLPVVTADVGAFSELVPPEAGVIVPADDLGGMVKAVRSFLDDDAGRKSAGHAAATFARTRHPLLREAEDLRKVYEGLWARG